ncbi:MAG: hypothetical protein Tsb002_31740 [Wenzhouxiangellaceae bacterium]
MLMAWSMACDEVDEVGLSNGRLVVMVMRQSSVCPAMAGVSRQAAFAAKPDRPVDHCRGKLDSELSQGPGCKY